MASADQVERNAHAAVAAFIPRARRVESHSLARDRTALLRLAQMSFPVLVDWATGTATMIQQLPPEELVESAAGRVRPLILNEDPTYHAKFTSALGYLLRGGRAAGCDGRLGGPAVTVGGDQAQECRGARLLP